MNLNYKEIGSIIRVNLGYGITAATPTLILQPEVGSTKEITTGVTIPAVTVVTELETFTGGQYIEYKTVVNDLDYVGRWRKKARLDFSSSNVQQNDFEKFRVLA
ncbi:MAG: hypothetical protein Unbinned1520contig1002_47 [Prokaryotic dsDNA virus sp.]|nr:MAG: hypothetical protein Unbinned1520contig1002_47 [Prokaryotic dsDNA virus sp.]|tara:strand:+ start:12880 stop:13191 length:312 start_codon:yes stop_codon:yes gene_type:complete